MCGDDERRTAFEIHCVEFEEDFVVGKDSWSGCGVVSRALRVPYT